MTDQAAALREPWETLPEQKSAALFGMWVFLASELLFFAAFFMAYAYLRTLHPEAFREASSHTDIVYGTINTVLLLTSSLTMVTADRLAALKLARPAVLCLAITATLGLAFLVVKGFEYSKDLDDHLLPGHDFALEPASALFFAFYWIVTVVHVIHLSIGIGAVVRLAVAVGRGSLPPRSPQFEITALYWSLVDVIWILLYPLIYLGGRGA